MLTSKACRRRGGLLAAGGIAALLVAAPSAGAATFGGGSMDLNLSGSFVKSTRGKLTATFPGRQSGSRGVSLPIAASGGTATLNARPTGTLRGRKDAGFELARGKRKASFDQCVTALTGNKARFRCKSGRKTVTLFQGKLKGGKIEPDSEFTKLEGKVRVKSTAAAAKFLKQRLKSGRRLKGGRKAGTLSVEAERVLTIVTGNSQTFYNQAFYDALQGCDIDLLALAPATAIPVGGDAPRGGVNLPHRPGGTLNAVTEFGAIAHDGGTQLNRPPGSAQGPEYVSDLLDFVFQLTRSPSLLASVPRLGLTDFNIGSVTGGVFSMELTDTGGSVTFAGADLVLSDLASGTLRGDTGCEIPSGSIIGKVQATSNVE